MMSFPLDPLAVLGLVKEVGEAVAKSVKERRSANEVTKKEMSAFLKNCIDYCDQIDEYILRRATWVAIPSGGFRPPSAAPVAPELDGLHRVVALLSFAENLIVLFCDPGTKMAGVGRIAPAVVNRIWGFAARGVASTMRKECVGVAAQFDLRHDNWPHFQSDMGR